MLWINPYKDRSVMVKNEDFEYTVSLRIKRNNLETPSSVFPGTVVMPHSFEIN